MDQGLLEKELAPDPTQTLEQCLLVLERSGSDPLLPYQFFSILRDVLGFSAGLLLLRRGSSERLIPAAAVALASTTIQKMRFQVADLSMHVETRADFAVLSSNHPLFDQKLPLATRTKYPRWLTLKLINQTKIEGLLLMADCPYEEVGSEALAVLLSGIKASFGAALAKNRQTFAGPADPELLPKLPRSPTQARVRLGDLAKLLSHEYLGSLAGSIELDLLAVIHRYFAAFPTAYLPDDHILAAALPYQKPDADIVVDAIRRQLKELIAATAVDVDLTSFFYLQ